MDERLHKLQSVEVGHVDVKENGVDRLFAEDFHGLGSTQAAACDFEERHLFQVVGELLERQGLIVNGYTFNHDSILFFRMIFLLCLLVLK